MMGFKFEMSINSYAYDVQIADASMYILTPRLWLMVAASGCLLPFSLKGAMAALATSGHGAIGSSARSEFSRPHALRYSAGFSDSCRACVVGQRSTKVAGSWFNPST